MADNAKTPHQTTRRMQSQNERPSKFEAITIILRCKPFYVICSKVILRRQSSVGEVLQFSQSVSEVAKTNITFETKAMFLPQGNLPAHTASRFRVESKRVQN